MYENRRLQSLYKILFFGVLAAASISAAQPRQRIHGNLDDGERFAVSGNVRPSLVNAQDQGAVVGNLPLTRMSIHFSMTPSQNADLMQLLQQQQTRHSVQFHKWLTPEEYADRFGVNEKDIQKVTAWLEGMGFTNVEPARSRNVITFDGTAAAAEMAFRTSIRSYSLKGTRHYANASAPELPVALSGMVVGIRGLNDFHPKPHAHPHFTSSISGNHYLTPDDFATIYDLQALYGSGIDGAGIKIAIPGQTDVDLADIQAFRTAAGLSAPNVQVILTGTDPGKSTDDLGEADLDIEWAGGVAKGAAIIYVNSSDVFTSMQYAITNNVADVLAVTYGLCEASAGKAEVTSLNNMFLQANAEGMTVTAASGDDGAADCDVSTDTKTVSTATQGLAVDIPASSPSVTGIGGTTFSEGTATYWSTSNNAKNGSAVSYIPEVAWNDTSPSQGFAASGGGASTSSTKPSWQTGTGVPADGARDVPDVALAASANHDGYLTCSAGSCVNGFRAADTTVTVSGGTSAGSPSFAAIIALLVQKTGTRQGNVNPILYTLASISADVFHDVTSGNNKIACGVGTPNCGTSGTLGYTTGAGYDQVTGLGSVDGNNLVNEWGADFKISLSPTSLSVSRGASGSATVTVAGASFIGIVTFTCSVASPLTNTTCSVPGTVTGSGTASVTITAGATAETPGWRRPKFPMGNGGMWWLMLAGAACLLSWRQKRGGWNFAAIGFALMLGVAGCGGGNSESSTTSSTVTTPKSETGVVTVTGTSGSLTNSATLSVTVQ